MPKQPITKERWQEHVSQNITSSYGLVVELLILMLWEAGVQDHDEAHAYLTHKTTPSMGVSGGQAGMAIGFALNYEPDGWVDQDMVKINEPTMKEIREKLAAQKEASDVETA